jgi:hypothetical protein
MEPSREDGACGGGAYPVRPGAASLAEPGGSGDEIAYAVLIHANSAATYEEIDAAVRAQIEESRRRSKSLYRDDAG